MYFVACLCDARGGTYVSAFTIDEERRNSLLWGQHGWGACNANRVRGKKIFRLRKPSTTDYTTPGKYITYSPNLGPGLEWALGTAF